MVKVGAVLNVRADSWSFGRSMNASRNVEITLIAMVLSCPLICSYFPAWMPEKHGQTQPRKISC
jgi:hypothetical protein